jgi:hypothetical protein
MRQSFFRRISSYLKPSPRRDISGTQPAGKAPSGADLATDRLLGENLDTELGQEGTLRTAVKLARTEH